ncbi:MAG: hypothetical protein HYS08_05585 [Chlamydiae bacterium]|nr:hypothetical protein [Chlamydiota bacterium]MBI3267189.1 hypothetical protein [Chlamydiota bacterium]
MKKEEKGILLIEALLALVVLSIAITATVRSFTYVAKVHRLTKFYLTALRLLETKMSEIEIQPELEEGESSGVFGKPDQDFKWNLRVDEVKSKKESEEEEENEKTVKFMKVDLQVSWRQGSEKRKIAGDTLLIKKVEKEDEEASEREAQEASKTGAHTH